MALRRLQKTLPETVNDDDQNLSFFEKVGRNARKNAKDSRKSFVCIYTELELSRYIG